jgi:hypothetical protein
MVAALGSASSGSPASALDLPTDPSLPVTEPSARPRRSRPVALLLAASSA